MHAYTTDVSGRRKQTAMYDLVLFLPFRFYRCSPWLTRLLTRNDRLTFLQAIAALSSTEPSSDRLPRPRRSTSGANQQFLPRPLKSRSQHPTDDEVHSAASCIPHLPSSRHGAPPRRSASSAVTSHMAASLPDE